MNNEEKRNENCVRTSLYINPRKNNSSTRGPKNIICIKNKFAKNLSLQDKSMVIAGFIEGSALKFFKIKP
ncbi:MAG: hypothetical protein NC925_05515, partial [Candidatus Omnitrophica bacterium]|nr:hypothetical protein [Candidatus Omnitrophota bacterium]